MDKYKTKEQLVKELAALRQQITNSGKSEVELKRAEEKLRESENRFRAIVNYTYDCESWTDPEGKLVWVNPAVFELTGYTVDECMGMADYPLTFIDERDRSTIARYVGEAIRGSSGKNVEFRLRCKDGSLKWGAVSWQPIYDAHGSSLGVRSSVRDITDRKQAAEALIASEEKYRRFFEDAVLGIFQSTPEGKIITVNPAYARMFGYSSPTELTTAVWDVATCLYADPSRHPPIVRMIKGKHHPVHVENVYKRKDGSTFVGNLHAWTARSSKGELILEGFVEDITRRKRMEEEILRAKEAWERTFASVPDLIAILDNQHGIQRVNEAMARRLGIKAEDVIGLKCYEAVHGLPEPPDFCPHSRTIKDGRQHVEEVHDDRLGGDFVVSTTPLHDDRGQLIGAVHVAHDITGRKRAEESLRESQERMCRAEEIAHLGSWELDVVRNRLSWSDEVYRIFGLHPQEFRATYDAFLDAVHPDDRAAVDAAYSGSVREGRDSYDIEHRVIRKSDGEVRTVREKCEHIRDGAGRIIRSVGMVSDITERRKAEEVLARAHKELEHRVVERTAELSRAYEVLQRETEERRKTEEQLRQSQKMEAIGTLAGGIAHDFNNILAAVIGFTEIAIDDNAPVNSAVDRALTHVLKAALRARDLVKQILAFSRKTDSEVIPLQLTPLIKETVKLLRASLPSSVEIDLKIKCTSDTVLADPSQMQQVVMNLCTNAGFAMRDKGGRLTIRLGAASKSSLPSGLEPGAYLLLTVRDTGTGIEPDAMQRIFEPFFTTKEPGQGTGMGLAVTYGIVKSLHGDITVESTPGKGSAFNIFIPEAEPSVQSGHTAEGDIPRGTERILFIDDEESLVKWGMATLRRLGYKVVGVTDGRDALSAFLIDPRRFDLVITDQTMPATTGIALAKKFLKVRPDIPIILYTGHNENVSPEKAGEAGIKGFLMKPLSKREMAEAVRRVLDERQGQK
ncbi:MAG TPA: PAS domain S-box protein [Syntrophorhabdaceae bacterium]|jgi:PAS domain S-box-containing protein